MLRATAVVRKPAVKPERVADSVMLDHRARAQPRGAVTGLRGLQVLLELEGEAVPNDGDAVRLEDGRLVEIRAAPERLLEVRAENPVRLMRFAWQLGSLHVSAEITADAIYLAADAALVELARGQGCTTLPVERPFKPERAAAHHDCGHDHHHHHGDHGHGHACGEAHEHGRAHSHGHGHGCGHDHHGHKHD